MLAIPPATETDAEDVVWGLQTAASLWNRGERGDAVAWLRRAAQAASDANDDDRALELARVAAELADSVTAEPEASGAPEPAVELVDAAGDSVSPHSLAPGAHMPSVLPAERVHAGMYDPWAEQRASAVAPPPAEPRSSAPNTPPPDGQAAKRPGADLEHDDEVVTSVATKPAGAPRAASVAAPSPPSPATRNVSKKPPPLPPRAAAKAPKLSVPPPLPPNASVVPRATPSSPSLPPPLPRATPSSPSLPPPLPFPPPPSSPSLAGPAPAPAAAPAMAATPEATSAEPAPALDLEEVDAFSDLPDDARAAFAAAAKVHVLAESDEVASFALAYIVEGEVDVAATMVDAPAARLTKGAVLRSRGTTEEGVPMRLISAVPRAVVATWSSADVDQAFSNCPWVEQDLRVASDRVMTLVGITIGPLGERLDQSLREQILARLTQRSLIPGEVVVNKGESVPGLLLVGVGELELVDGDAVKGVVSSGDFLFAGEVLGAGAAPSTARAGSGGALIMFGDRHVAQELMVTCPPLLEVFAGM